MRSMKPILSILGVTTLLLGPIGLDPSSFGATAAFAGNGNEGGNGNSGGNGGGNGNSGDNGNSRANEKGGSSKPDKAGGSDVASVKSKSKDKTESKSKGKSAHGLLASELKGLNAAHANPNALANANPNSQVGRLATYRNAALAAAGAQDAVDAANTALGAFDDANQGRSIADIEADIAALDPTIPGYDPAQLDTLDDELTAAQIRDADRAVLLAAVIAAEDAMATAGATEDDALLAASNGRTLSPEAIAYIRELLNI